MYSFMTAIMSKGPMYESKDLSHLDTELMDSWSRNPHGVAEPRASQGS